MEHLTWDRKFEKCKCWHRVFIFGFVEDLPCIWRWARLAKQRQIRPRVVPTKANTAPCCPWKVSRGGTKQMILRSCFGLFFTCGKTRDKATEQERREVRTTSGKISLLIKFAEGIYSCKGQIMEIYKTATKGIRRSSHAPLLK